MHHAKILAIDDEKNIRRLIRNEFSLEGFDVVTAKNGEEGLKYFDKENFNLVLLDIKLPEMSGIEILRRIKYKSASAAVIMITGYGDIQSAVQCIKLGASDYVTKPFKLDELITLVAQTVKANFLATDALTQTGVATPDEGNFIQCPSPAMQSVYQLMHRIAPTEHPVLLQGETGVGKDVLAYQIHLNSLRKEGPFVTLDCGLLNQNLAESELYGHRKGAFSGATESKPGLVEQSAKGTLFLDEIGNIDLELQKKFLRFLETRKFRRVGETKESSVDTRIIMATNMNLEEAVQKGIFRKDLFYRINDIVIVIPPLRQRPEDVSCLAKHFFKKNAVQFGPQKISYDAAAILTDYHWPGNVREMKSVINKAMLFAETDTIVPSDLPSQIANRKNLSLERPISLIDMEKQHIMATLEKTGGHQSNAAKILGINRKTLYKKIHKYKLFSS